jgi:cell division protein FtsI (penicillin-binding protein 3)
MRLLEPMKTELGPVAAPQVPQRWGEIETMTVSYGHGLAVAPLQFATAGAAIVNGGNRVLPTFIKRQADAGQARVALLRPETSATLRDLMRRNVGEPGGTGRRADVPGYAVGGKTGTAELPGVGGYRKKEVISSFLAAFPMTQPKYLVFVLLFEPKGTDESGGEVLAGRNAAPTTARIVSRIGPLLGMLPRAAAAGRADTAFDGTSPAKYEAR